MFNNYQSNLRNRYKDEVRWDNDSPEDKFKQLNDEDENVKNIYQNILFTKKRVYNDVENDNDGDNCDQVNCRNDFRESDSTGLDIVQRLRSLRFKAEDWDFSQTPDFQKVKHDTTEIKMYDNADSKSNSTTEDKVKRKMNVRKKKFHRQEIKAILVAVIKAECFVEQLKYQTEDIDTWNMIVREYGFNRRAEDIKNQVVVMLRQFTKAINACVNQNLFNLKELKKENDCLLSEDMRIKKQTYINCCMQELQNGGRKYGSTDWWEKEICDLLMQIYIKKNSKTVRLLKEHFVKICRLLF
jgi:hypothetical protein